MPSQSTTNTTQSRLVFNVVRARRSTDTENGASQTDMSSKNYKGADWSKRNAGFEDSGNRDLIPLSVIVPSEIGESVV